MKILDVLNAPWAILPDKLFEITEIYSTHLRGEKIDLAAVEARIGKPLQNSPKGYVVTDGVAIVPVEGVLAKRMNMMMSISGGTSMDLLGRELTAALEDPAVNAVVLAIDSPGGTVDGTQALADIVLGARASDKPVVAWVDGMMASAAYWIGSAADAVYLGAGTDQVGSIGVAMQHVDYSGRDAQMGIKRTDIYAGAYKRIASDTGPLGPDGRAYLQGQTDTLYSLFVDAVAANRGVSVEQVLTNMADGRVFIGQQAIDAGLADGFASLDQLVATLAAGQYPRQRAPRTAAGAAAVAGFALAGADPAATPTAAGAAADLPTSNSGDPMDIATLKEKYPDVAKALIDEGHAAGAQAERARIQSVEAQAMPGHDALITQLKFDGKTTGPEAAVQVLAAEREKGAKRLADLRADAPAPAPAQASASGDPAAEAAAAQAAEEANLTIEERSKRQWERDPKVRAEFGTLERFTSYEKARERGLVKA